MLAALLAAFGAVFIAELGDKTQLVVIACAVRYRWTTVLAALAAATVVVTLAGAVAGGIVGAALPVVWVRLAAACAFLGFAFWTVRERDDAAETYQCASTPFRTVAGAFLLAEMGDKTQLVTLTLAATSAASASDAGGRVLAALPVWVGATAGMVAADALGLIVGLVLHKNLPRTALRWTAAVLFAAFGLVNLRSALAGLLGGTRADASLVLVAAVVGLLLWVAGRRKADTAAEPAE